MEPVLGDHLQPSLLHPSVLPGVVPHTALVDVVSHCIVTSPPKVEEEMFVKTAGVRLTSGTFAAGMGVLNT